MLRYVISPLSCSAGIFNSSSLLACRSISQQHVESRREGGVLNSLPYNRVECLFSLTLFCCCHSVSLAWQAQQIKKKKTLWGSQNISKLFSLNRPRSSTHDTQNIWKTSENRTLQVEKFVISAKLLFAGSHFCHILPGQPERVDVNTKAIKKLKWASKSSNIWNWDVSES